MPEAAEFEKPLLQVPLTAADEEDNTVVSRILECVDAADRARCALTMLMQGAECYLGYLYGVQGERLVPLAGVPLRDAQPELEGWLSRWFAAECESANAAAASVETVTENLELATHTQSADTNGTQTADTGGSQTADASPHVRSEYIDGEGRRFYAVLVNDQRNGARRAVAVLVMHAEQGVYRRPPPRLSQKIATLLITHGDVPGVEPDGAAAR